MLKKHILYTREQASKLKQAFWTTFGQYMTAVPSSEGIKVNWINYKTGFKHLFFKMNADNRNAFVFIEISHPDLGIQELFFEQFKELKYILHNYLDEEWDWKLHTEDEYGRIITKISTQIQDVTIFRQEDWPTLISFFKPRIIALDEFWNIAKYNFEALK